jgi:hypothetical protein
MRIDAIRTQVENPVAWGSGSRSFFMTDTPPTDGSVGPGAADAPVPEQEGARHRTDSAGHHAQDAESSSETAVEVTHLAQEVKRVKEATDEIRKQRQADKTALKWLTIACTAAAFGVLMSSFGVSALQRMGIGLWDMYVNNVPLWVHFHLPGVAGTDQNKPVGVLTPPVRGDSGELSSELRALLQDALQPSGEPPLEVRKTILSAAQPRDGEWDKERIDALMAGFRSPVVTDATAHHNQLVLRFTSKFEGSGEPQTVTIPVVSDVTGRHIADPGNKEVLEGVRDKYVGTIASKPDLPRFAYRTPLAPPARPVDRAKREEFSRFARQVRKSKTLFAGRRLCELALADAGNLLWLSQDADDPAKLAEALDYLQGMVDTRACAAQIGPALHLLCGVRMVLALQQNGASAFSGGRQAWDEACAKATQDASASTDPLWRISKLNHAGAVVESGDLKRGLELFLYVENVCRRNDDPCSEQAAKQSKKLAARLAPKADPDAMPKESAPDAKKTDAAVPLQTPAVPEQRVVPEKENTSRSAGSSHHKEGHRAAHHRHHRKPCASQPTRHSACDRWRRWLQHHPTPCASFGVYGHHRVRGFTHIFGGRTSRNWGFG